MWGFSLMSPSNNNNNNDKHPPPACKLAYV
jgi:hypothetical protein